jgi:hypothetical protein
MAELYGGRMKVSDDLTPEEAHGNSPWMCHVCNISSRGESAVCDICFRTACPAHLRRTTIYNEESGLYEFASICIDCAAEKMME